jgi:hypothetical protein
MKKVALVLAVMLVLAGCAAQGVSTLGTFTAGDGSTVDYVRGWWRAPMDVDGSVVDRYQTKDGKTQLIAHDAGFDGGWGKKTVSMAIPAAIMGGSYMGGSALIRPSNVSQIGGGATQSQGQGNIGINAQAQGQAQGQMQGQLQGQLQGQSQALTHGNFSPATAIAP